MASTASSISNSDPQCYSIVDSFRSLRHNNPDMPIAAAVISCLTYIMKISTASTMAEIQTELKKNITYLLNKEKSISILAACDLYNQCVTRTSSNFKFNDFILCKNKLIERGDLFTSTFNINRSKISKYSDSFIRNNKTILVHGYSRVVLSVLKYAALQGKDFKVICTEGKKSDDESAGISFYQQMVEAKIPCELILDSAVAYYMETIDLVLIGAEGVVESGGIINLIGTYQIAIIAKTLNRPLYVAVESFKFVRLYPLHQTDVPNTDSKSNTLAKDVKVYVFMHFYIYLDFKSSM